MKFIVGFYLIVISIAAQAVAPDMKVFLTHAQEKSAAYSDVENDAGFLKLLREGRASEANARLIGLVPDEKKTEIDDFVLGNLLFDMDAEASQQFMMKAEALDPDNPAILYERGIEEHRRGDCKAALDYYTRVQKTEFGEKNVVLWAYSTQCYLRQGQRTEALAAWSKAQFGEHHVGIETAMYAVFGEPSPAIHRQAIMREVLTGNTDLLCDLLHGDQNWEYDWWNVREVEEYTSYDRDIAARILKTGSPELKRFQLCDSLDSLDDVNLRKQLDALGIWGAVQNLPPSPALSYAIIRKLTDHKLASEADLLKAFEGPLKSRLQAQPKISEWIDILAYLYSATDNSSKLHELDDYGWHTLHRREYAESYVTNLADDLPELKSALAQALVEFPNSRRLTLRDLKLKFNTPQKDAAKMQFAASQFAHVAEPNEYRLNNYMIGVASDDDK